MNREEIVNDLLNLLENSNIDPDSDLYKNAQYAIFCVESNDIFDGDNDEQ